MEPEQRPGSSGPPNIQTTADGQPFIEGSETKINLPIIPPLLDLSAENREMPKLPPTLDGPEIKEKNIEVITDIDEHQRIYISGDYPCQLCLSITQIIQTCVWSLERVQKLHLSSTISSLSLRALILTDLFN